MQYSEMECICARKITEGLLRESESPKTVSKALCTLSGGPMLQFVKPIGKSGTGGWWSL